MATPSPHPATSRLYRQWLFDKPIADPAGTAYSHSAVNTLGGYRLLPQFITYGVNPYSQLGRLGWTLQMGAGFPGVFHEGAGAIEVAHFQAAHTVYLWFKPAAEAFGSGTNICALHIGSIGGAHGGYVIVNRTTRVLTLAYSGGVPLPDTAGVTVEAGKQYMLAWTHEQSGSTWTDKVYLNGVLVSTSTGNSNPPGTIETNITVGAYRTGASTVSRTYEWLGGIDEVTLLTGASTAAEVAAAYTLGTGEVEVAGAAFDYPTAEEVINDTGVELGLWPTDLADPYAASVTDQNVLVLRRLLKGLGQMLVRAHGWQQLRRTKTLSTANGTATYALPTDYARSVEQTAYNNTDTRPLFGQTSPQAWSLLTAQNAIGLGSTYFRIGPFGLELKPTPTSVQSLSFDYVSRLWVRRADLTEPNAEEPTASTDVLHFDRQLLIRGLKLLWLRNKGMPTDAAQADYEVAFGQAIGSDSPAPVLSLSGGPYGPKLIDWCNVRPTGWGLP